MTILTPLGLVALLAVPVIVLLWLLHSRFHSARVPSLLLWQDIPMPVVATRAWRLPRLELLLILQLAAAGLVALALSRPAIDALAGRHVALVLDASASMQAQDVAPTRFDVARQQLLDVLGTSRSADRFSFVLAGKAPVVAVRDGSPADVREALQSARAEDGPGDLPTALRVAAAPDTTEVVVATDGAAPLDIAPLSAPVSFRLVGNQSDQVALSDVAVRQPIDGSSKLSGFASVVNYGSAPALTEVQIIADAVLVDSQPITIAPGARTEVTFSVPTGTRGLRVQLAGSDKTQVDLAAPARFARQILIVSDAPAVWERVLVSDPFVSTRSIGPADYQAPATGELVLFDGWLPADLPDAERILVNPPDRPGILVRETSGSRTIGIRDLDMSDPLLHGLDMRGLSITTNTRAATPDWASLTAGSVEDFELGHGVLQGRRTVLFGFDPAASNLAELAAFPLLVSNAVDWLTPGRGDVVHAGLGPAVDITPHPLQPIPARADRVRSPDWFELWPVLAGLGAVLLAAELGWALRTRAVRGVPTIVSGAAGVAIVVALVQPGLWLPDRAMTVVLAVDRSASVSAESQASLATWLKDALQAKPASDRVGVVNFGRDSSVVQALSTDGIQSGATDVGSDATDLGQALRTAAALARGQRPARVVLLSDGQATTGDLESTLGMLSDIPVDVVPLGELPHTPPVILESLDLPRYVRSGDAFDATLAVGSLDQTAIGLHVSLDGRPVRDQLVTLVHGQNQLTLNLSIDVVGFHRLVVDDGTESVENFVVVKPPEHVMVVEERPGESGGVVAALRGVAGTIDVRPPGAVTGLAQLDPYDAIVLANVSATSFTLDQQRTLQSFVRDRGRGLVAVGGQTSFVLGDYEGSVLEQVLPVQSTIPPRREDARMALLLVIDISQSMDRTVDGVTSIAMAKQAAVIATQALRDDDQVGVLVFNHKFSWLQPMGRLADIGRPVLEEKIATLTPSGGTEIFAALDEGTTAMRATTADLRHIVLFTDGNSRDANYDVLTAQLKADRIGLSTVGLGPEADTKLLAKLAKDGQGRFYYSDRPTELPRILAGEVAIAKRSSVVEGTIQPRLAEPGPIMRGIAPDEVPSLGGFIATTPRSTAQVILQTDDQKPLLAQWRIGLGRTVAWTSDVGGVWTRPWADWANNARLWQQAVGWAEGVPIQPDFLLVVTSSGSAVRITLDDLNDEQFVDLASPVATITAPGSAQSNVILRQSAPGRYETSLIADRAGTYEVSVVEGRRTETSGFVVRNRPEQASFGADEHTLRRITSATGGRVLRQPAEAFRDDGRQAGARWQPLWQLLVALGLVLFVVGLAMRRLAWPERFTAYVADVAGGARRRLRLRPVRR